MRIAIISDIHANLTALEAVLNDLRSVGADVTVIGGDLVGNGARPAEVVDCLRNLDCPCIYGNSDEMLWNDAAVDAHFANPLIAHRRAAVDRTIAATRDALGDARINWLKTLPDIWRADDLAIVHASPTSVWRAPGPLAADEELVSVYQPLRATRVVYGHIHQPFVRRLPSLIIANSGSVGQPYDGDPRAAYLVVDGQDVSIRRVEYAIEQEIAALQSSGHPGSDAIALALRTGRSQRS